MTNLLVKNFLRSKGLMLGLLMLFVVGLISLHIGKIFLDQQANTVEKTAEFQKENIQRHLKHVKKDIGLLLYYIRFGIVNAPHVNNNDIAFCCDGFCKLITNHAKANQNARYNIEVKVNAKKLLSNGICK